MRTHHRMKMDFVFLGDEVASTIDVEYTFYPGCRGSRDSLGGIRGAGPPLEPDDPAEVEITGIFYDDENVIDGINDAELSAIEQRIWEHIQERDCDQEPPEPPEYWEYEKD